ncbi:MFS transporter [Aspergillus lucknowensis]|uniref:Major facilitator superfamily domain-containing protein n=1 Tax=Aspergillus lucknowensis TaxID=176173 RepID=A0ABR4LWW4_9EURO
MTPPLALEVVEFGPTNIVDFVDSQDGYDPLNWPFFKKTYTSLLYSLTSLGSVWASTAYAPANDRISETFHVSSQVAVLGTSFLLLGWGFGPLIWAPLSELYGRKWPILLPFAISMAMSFGTATGKDIQTVLITRFFTGFFGSAPITGTGGVFVDLWAPAQRGNAIVGYTLCVCGGPALGPVVGGAIIYSGVDWRWTEYILLTIHSITAVIQLVILTLDVIFIEESYPPVLLTNKARKLRKSTGNWALHSEWEENDILIRDLAVKFGLRPLQMLATPICLAITIYSSFIYAVFYASLASFPIIFQQTRHWNPLVGSLPFIAVLVGIILGATLSWYNQQYYNRALAANDMKSVPEARLPPMMVASVVLTAGLFIMGWTSTTSIPWIATVIGVCMMGFGYYTIFTSAVNYLVDTFHRWGASALAANTFARSVLAAVLPLLVKPWYEAMGNGWAFSVLGVFAALNIPIPFVFWVYGARIRAMGRFTSNMG